MGYTSQSGGRQKALVSDRAAVAMTGWVRVVVLLLGFTATRALVDDVLEALKIGKEIGEEILSSWEIIGKPFNATGGVDLPIMKRRERQVLARLDQVTRTIQRLELNIESTKTVAMLLAKKGGSAARLELRLHELSDLLARVSSGDRQMKEYVRLHQELERTTLNDFAMWCVSHDRGALPGLLERVHSLIVPPHQHLLGRGLFQLILDDLQVGRNF